MLAWSERGRVLGRKTDRPWLDIDVNAVMNEIEPLTAIDRCDACGAQAYVRVRLESGMLLFCGHHANQHLDSVAAIAVGIDDERERIGTL